MTTSSATTFARTVDGPLADVVVGDNVTVMGTTSTTTVTATAIRDTGTEAPIGGGDGPPPAPPGGDDDGQLAPPGGGDGGPGGFAGGPPTRGVVAAVDGTTLTVTLDDGSTMTVSTSDSTAVSVRETIALADLAPGDAVRVAGPTGSDGTVAAETIEVGAAGFAGRSPRPVAEDADGEPPRWVSPSCGARTSRGCRSLARRRVWCALPSGDVRSVRRAKTNREHPQRDSNPCYRLERAASWATGRWGPAIEGRATLAGGPSGSRQISGLPPGSLGSGRPSARASTMWDSIQPSWS